MARTSIQLEHCVCARSRPGLRLFWLVVARQDMQSARRLLQPSSIDTPRHCRSLARASQVKLAKKLVEQSFADKAFFCNSGTEANEAAIKFARKWARVKGAARQEHPVTLCLQHPFTASQHGSDLCDHRC